MATQTAVWTLLPNGISHAGALKVSALVSPRLTLNGEPPELAQFGAFVNWPARLANATFVVHYAGQQIEAVPFWQAAPQELDLQDDPSAPDSALWNGLFPPDTFVRSHSFDDHSGKFIVSFPTKHILSFIEEFYGELAVSVWDRLPNYGDLPKLDGRHLMNGSLNETPTLGSRDSRLKEMKQAYKEQGAIPPRTKRDFDEDFNEFALYHLPAAKIKPMSNAATSPDTPAEWLAVEQVDLPAAGDFAAGAGAAEHHRLDFHQMAAGMNQYPALLRRLGLVVDLLVPRPRGLGKVADGQLWLEVAWPRGAGTLAETGQPRTHASLGRASFVPVPRSVKSGLAGGLLDLSQDRYDVIQLDPSGSAMKLTNFGRSSYLARNQNSGEATGVPALRGPSLAVIETGRALRLAERFKTTAKINNQFELQNAQQPAELYAEDLVKGYRVDVLDRDKWRSLCRRIGRYEISGQANPLIVEDENAVQMGVTESPDRRTNPDADQLYLGETVFDWGGWSLAAPRPGATVDPEDAVSQVPADVNDQKQNPAAPGIDLEANFRVKPGSLPRLRYGETYRFRARIADLAGNSLPPTTEWIGKKGPSSPVSEEAAYLRYAPVPSPAMALVLQTGQQEGDLEVLEGESMERLAIRTFNDPADFGGDVNAADTSPSAQVAERHAIPPRVAHAEAERHGVLDDVQGNPDKALYGLLSSQDSPLPSVVFQHPAPNPGDPDIEATYSYGDAVLNLPYLPDPLARGAAVRYLDHPALPPDSTELYPFNPQNAGWPDRQAFRIRVVEGSVAPQLVDQPDGTRVLEVPVPKGETVSLLLGCTLEDEDLEIMGAWSWIVTRLAASDPKLEQIRGDALRGRHWMITPWRRITLVSAVQQPLGVPVVHDLDINRGLNDTGLWLSYHTPLHRKSTMKLDTLADWNEPKDDPKSGGPPENVVRDDHAFEYKVPIQEPLNQVVFKRVRHEIGDTRYRKIRYHAVSTTRYREYLSPAVLGDPPDKTRIIRTSTKAEGYVENSARPPAPEVLYVVPTYGWSSRKEQDGVRRDRNGGGLRIYLDRPWYVSGYGEMLAVVMPPQSATLGQVDGELKPFVTQWGQDPIWATGSVIRATPRANQADFPLARFTAADAGAALEDPFIPDAEKTVAGPESFKITGLSLAERPSRSVSVAPHTVGFDSERGLWYCDVEVRGVQSYTPFIRLALARYHPVSKTGAHISAVVQAEYTQLAPDRSAVLTKVPHEPGKYKLAVYGRRPDKSSTAAELDRESPAVPDLPGIEFEPPLLSGDLPDSTVIRIGVEQQDPELGPDFGWHAVSGAAIAQQKTPQRATRIYTPLDLPVLWNGTITLPPESGEGGRYRIVIREYETFIADPGRRRWIERVVYADIFEL